MQTGQTPAAPGAVFRRIPSRDVELAADAYGDETDPPVVLLHGGGQTRHSWRDTAARLGADGWFALSVDLRGHGDSGWSPDGGYGLARFAADIVAVRNALDRRPVLIGASLGGLAGLAALNQQPDLALGLVLVDVSPFVQTSGTNRISAFMRARPDGFASLDEVADAVAAYLPHRPRPREVGGLRKNLRLVDGRWYWHWDPAFLRPPADGAPGDHLLDPVRLGVAASSIRVPTLLVRGGNSDVLSVDDARRFLELVPHAEYVDVAGARHMIAGDDNAVFDRRIIDFLDRRIRPRLRLAVGGG
jgi:pimeloyl-ACP methyl ester carboxylesterase